MRMATVSRTAGQTLLLVVVRVNITIPLCTSFELNAYTDTGLELLLNVPEPEVDHDAEVAEPLSAIVFWDEHTTALLPAETVAMGAIGTVTVLSTIGQTVLLVLDNVKTSCVNDWSD